VELIIAAGGTGGHVFPALAVALAGKEIQSESTVLWFGTTRAQEKQICAANGFTFIPVTLQSSFRKLHPRLFIGIVAFIRETIRARRILRKHPHAHIIAFGGYPCGPMLLAAKVSRRPYYLQEQNCIAGKVVKLFASGAQTVFCGLPLQRSIKAKQIVLSGNPVRSGEIRTAKSTTTEITEKIDPAKQLILITGGSQGAFSVNEVIKEILPNILEHNCQVVWQMGKKFYERYGADYSAQPGVIACESIQHMYPVLAQSSFVIARAGAMSIAEALAFKLPMLLIPLPLATENHQWHNAQWVEQNQAGFCIEQEENLDKILLEKVLLLLQDKKMLQQYAQNCARLAKVDAAEKIVMHIAGAAQ